MTGHSIRLAVKVGFCFFAVALASCVAPKPSGTQQALDALARSQDVRLPRPGQLDAQQQDDLRVRRILDRWIDAQGGRKRLDLVKSVRCMLAVADAAAVNYIQTSEAPGAIYRYELVGAESLMCGGYDGRNSWQKRGGLGASIHAGSLGMPYWASLSLLTQRLEQVFPRRKLLPEELVDDRLCSVLALGAGDGPDELWYFDVGTGLLTQIVRKVPPAQQVVLRYSDYKSISRVVIPHELVVTEPGGVKIAFRTVNAELSVTASKVVFSPPEELSREQGEIDGILQRSLAAGLGKSSESRACLTHATLFSTTTGAQTKLKVYRRKPGYVLVEKESPGSGRTVCGFDGKIGWENSEILGYHVMKDAEVNELFSLSWLGCDPFLRERFPLRTKEGAIKEGDRELVQLRLRNTSGLSGLFSFDKETSQLVRVEIGENPNARIQALKVEYGDYRPVDTLMMPFRVTYLSGGIETVVTCDKVDLDVDMPDALFQPRTETD